MSQLQRHSLAQGAADVSILYLSLYRRLYGMSQCQRYNPEQNNWGLLVYLYYL